MSEVCKIFIKEIEDVLHRAIEEQMKWTVTGFTGDLLEESARVSGELTLYTTKLSAIGGAGLYLGVLGLAWVAPAVVTSTAVTTTTVAAGTIAGGVALNHN